MDYFSNIYLNDSVLAALDGLAELLCTLRLQTLVKDLLKRIHCIVHLLDNQRHKHINILLLYNL